MTDLFGIKKALFTFEKKIWSFTRVPKYIKTTDKKEDRI
jgi:hypothetical protein